MLNLEQATDKAIVFLKEKGGHSTCRPVSGKCEGGIYNIEIDVGLLTKHIIEVQIGAESGAVMYCQEVQWRPEGWKNPHSPDGSGTFLPSDPDQIFEAGADAILKALKEKGAWMTPEQMRLLAPDRKYPYGHLVFIPETR